MNKLWVISNYNQDPSGLIGEIGANYIVFNQGDIDHINRSVVDESKIRASLHSGHNISDYLEFIIQNYDYLPDNLGLIKGNIVPRHISKPLFDERINEEGFVPYYGDEVTYLPQRKRLTRQYVAQQIAPGVYLEINNNWYVKTRGPGRFYPTFSEMYVKLFGRNAPEYILFVPGACMSVPRKNVLRWDRDLYKHLYEAVTYEFFPVEAFHLERCLLTLWGFPKE